MSILSILLEITVYSALIFCFIMLFKKLFGKHISPTLNYLIWLLLVVRLIMPVTIDSGFRLFTIPAESVPVSENVQAPTADTANTDIYIPDKNISEASNSAAADFSRQPNGISQPSVSAEPATVNPFNWSTLLLYVWITGMVLSILYLAWSYLYLKKRIGKSAVSPNTELSDIFHQCVRELGIKRDIRMVLQDEISSPALLVFPVMLIPADIMHTMDKQQIAFAIKHELMHYKRKDHIACLLLSLLQAVYWFNPFIWMAYRQIRMDMETACDSMVVKTMDGDERLKYAATVLSLFSRKKQLPVMLGMAVVNTKKTAEKRLKGIYMKQKSNRKGRLAAAMLACVMLITCFTTACQPTPEKEVVVNKNNNDLNEKIDQSASPVESDKSLQQTMSIPTKWTDSFENQNGEISYEIDATIVIPNVDKVPVASVTPIAFTQDQVDQMVKVLLDGNELYEPQEMTREQIQSEIVEIQAEITEADKQPDSNDKSMWLENLQNQLDLAKEQYNKTPEELKKIPATSKIGTIKDNINYTGVKVMADTDVGCMLFRVANGDNGSTVVINQQTSDGASYKEYRYVHEAVETPKGVLITREEAENKAKGIARELDEGLELAYTGVAEAMWQEQVWQMVFIREVDGFPSTYETHEIGGNESVSMTGPVVSYEKMIISINDKGIAEFAWYTPMKVDKIANENVKLMPFSNIQSTAKDMVTKIFNDIAEQRKADTAVTHTSVTLDKVTLGLMRIGVKDEPGQYKLIPVWDFYGYSENTLKNSENIPKEKLISGNTQTNYSLLTINAIDGSVIDRGLGY